MRQSALGSGLVRNSACESHGGVRAEVDTQLSGMWGIAPYLSIYERVIVAADLNQGGLPHRVTRQGRRSRSSVLSAIAETVSFSLTPYS